MARTKKRNHSKNGKSFTVPLGVVAGFVPPVVDLWGKKGNPMAFGNELLRITTGIDYWEANWDWTRMKWGLLPVIGGVLIHKFVGGKLGVNRMLAQAGVPFIRI